MENEVDAEDFDVEVVDIPRTADDIRREIASVFPFRTGDGGPDFRPGQERLCVDAVDSLVNQGKRAVAVDAPVGSGKSVVNFCIATTLGRSVYVTAQKQLQDQLDEDNLPDVRVVKGRNSYRCNYVFDESAGAYDCGCDLPDSRKFARDIPKTCKNTKKVMYNKRDNFNELLLRIRISLREDVSAHERRRRTSFRSEDEIKVFVEACRRIAEEELAGKMQKEDVFVMKCACVIAPFECPVKSARFIAEQSKVAVLNPDVYYLLRSVVGCFRDRSVMVVDEAHRLDSAVQRMFRAKLPIRAVEESTGICLDDVVAATDAEAAATAMTDIIDNRLIPILSAGAVMEDVEDDIRRSEASAMTTLHHLDAVFSRFPETDNPVRNQYESVFVGLKIPIVNINIAKSFPNIKSAQKLCLHIIALKEMLYNTIFLLRLMINIKYRDDKRVFRMKTIREHCVFGETVPGYGRVVDDIRKWGDEVDVLEFTPMHIGTILQMLFFGGMNQIILSSGTWPLPRQMIRDFGFASGSAVIMRVASTFRSSRRKIFCWGDVNAPDFSLKTEDGKGYWYGTDAGRRSYCEDVYSVIRYIRKSLGHKTNIAIHTFSYQIAEAVAERWPFGKDCLLAHTKTSMFNKIIMESVGGDDKETLVSRFRNHPDSGLVLISPSIMEGLDFKHGICRAQIILKAPVPYMGDAYVEGKKNGVADIDLAADPTYVDRLFAIDLCQTYGRVMRDASDWGETYIMDLTITRKLAKRFNVSIPGDEVKPYGSLNGFNLDYIQEGLQLKNNGYRQQFVWPLDGDVISRPYLK